MVTFEQIRKQFDESLGYIQADLRKVRCAEPVNYTAALLISCGCEIIAKRRLGEAGKANEVFAQLLPPTAEFHLISATLYDGLRNGLVHSFDTQRIVFKNGHVSITIAWKEGAHLSVTKDLQAAPSIVLNMQTLADRLSARIEQYRDELQSTPAARDKFFTSWQSDEQATVHTSDIANAWSSLTGENFEPVPAPKTRK